MKTRSYPYIVAATRLLNTANLQPELPTPPEHPNHLSIKDVEKGKTSVDYEQELAFFQIQQEEYELELHELLSRVNVKHYRQTARLELLQRAPKPLSAAGHVQRKRGASESFFCDILKKKFAEKILTNVFFVKHNSVFYPDFLYWDPDSNLTIDIEIDEPYVGYSGHAIHHLSSRTCTSVDDERDAAIASKLWVVVRFAEEQIFNHPAACAEYIARLAKSIINNLSLNFTTQLVPRVQKWTEEEAAEMARLRYRNQYVPNNLQGLIRIREV
ncbi:MAG: hypothetical protein LBK47_00915 [Prevotellaceae bacterium]|jgi:hypothetical protein|nr:hypothetical protein [Prevotellaceae bacterium]